MRPDKCKLFPAEPDIDDTHRCCVSSRSSSTPLIGWNLHVIIYRSFVILQLVNERLETAAFCGFSATVSELPWCISTPSDRITRVTRCCWNDYFSFPLYRRILIIQSGTGVSFYDTCFAERARLSWSQGRRLNNTCFSIKINSIKGFAKINCKSYQEFHLWEALVNEQVKIRIYYEIIIWPAFDTL